MTIDIKLTDLQRTILEVVVSNFVAQRKPTSQRHLFVRFQDPEAVEGLVSKSLLMDVDRQAVLPNMLSFELCGDQAALNLARNSLETVLLALRALYLESEENKQITPTEIEAKAQQIGRDVNPNTVWLGLYLVQNFVGVINSSAGSADRAQLSWVAISHEILKLKQIEKVWGLRVSQQMDYITQREAYRYTTQPQPLDDVVELSGVTFPNETALLIFISHSSRDADLALMLIELLKSALALRDEQIRCTSVDGFRLPAGVNTDDVLKAEVRQARAFIGLITPNSMNSAYVMFELGARWGAELHMVPLLAGVNPDALAGPLKPINSLSATNDAQLHQLVHELAAILQVSIQNPASYTRYIRKLTEELQRRNWTSTRLSQMQAPEPPGRSGTRKIDNLTRERVSEIAKNFVWSKQLPKWTVIVEGRELPVRPLVLQAVGALPNDSTTSNAATAKLKSLGFEIRYNGKKA